MKKKTFVLDTNVLLFDSMAIMKLGANDIVIPITVIEEIDKFKKDLNENGRNARHISRFLDEMRRRGSLLNGVQLDNKGTLYVDLPDDNQSHPALSMFEGKTADNTILLTALKHKTMDTRKEVVFITKDTNLRIKADLLGVKSVDYEPGDQKIDELYSGTRYVECTKTHIDNFFKEKKLPLTGLKNTTGIRPNEYVILKDVTEQSHTALGRYDANSNMIVQLLRGVVDGVWGIIPRNVEQIFALDMLLNQDMQLVSLIGKAGTGKTLLAIAAGLSLTIDGGAYAKLLVSRPIFPLGKDIGYLPGDVEEKLNPWMAPIFDNLEYILGAGEAASGGKKKPGSAKKWQELINQGMLNIEPLTYIRGRSIANQYLIVDEAQNLTPHEIKTIITRAGNYTKIVLTGDCFQIDNPYIDSSSNGLSYIVDRFKDQKIAGHITLVKGERSELAELAANLL
ncbi:MAG: PhoH family protein [Pseudomonadota bacterium]